MPNAGTYANNSIRIQFDTTEDFLKHLKVLNQILYQNIDKNNIYCLILQVYLFLEDRTPDVKINKPLL